MGYTTERGVTSYSDRDTPSEYATGQDEDAARFNEARDRAFSMAEVISSLLDDLYSDPIPPKHGEMNEIADAIEALAERVKTLTA